MIIINATVVYCIAIKISIENVITKICYEVNIAAQYHESF